MLVVLDDDPTGTQAVAGVDVVLDWMRDPRVEGDAIYVETNARAVGPAEATALVASATAWARARWPACEVILRGDSTLRGHVLEEYEGVCRVVGATPPLLLAPALPAAGRVTVDGVQWVAGGDGCRVPAHETEYARDERFSYDDARLARWAEERSRGIFRAAEATEVRLPALRERGAAAVRDAVAAAVPRSVVVADAETDDDVAAIAEGVRLAWDGGSQLLVRCGPTLAAHLANRVARSLVAPPGVEDVLVVAGSFVSGTTRQLSRLEAARPGTLVEAELDALVREDPNEVARLAAAAAERLARTRLAVVATPRARRPLTAQDASAAARTLAQVAAAVPAGAVVAKGGVTSAVTARDGLGAASARVEGPILRGVSLWSLRTSDGERPYVVVPGNVGDDDLLLDLVSLLGA